MGEVSEMEVVPRIEVVLDLEVFRTQTSQETKLKLNPPVDRKNPLIPPVL